MEIASLRIIELLFNFRGVDALKFNKVEIFTIPATPDFERDIFYCTLSQEQEKVYQIKYGQIMKIVQS